MIELVPEVEEGQGKKNNKSEKSTGKEVVDGEKEHSRIQRVVDVDKGNRKKYNLRSREGKQAKKPSEENVKVMHVGRGGLRVKQRTLGAKISRIPVLKTRSVKTNYNPSASQPIDPKSKPTEDIEFASDQNGGLNQSSQLEPVDDTDGYCIQPQMMQPQIMQPQMLQPQMMQPQMMQPQMMQPQMMQPQMMQPQMMQPQIMQPQMTQPQMMQPQIMQPQMIQPLTIQSQIMMHPLEEIFNPHFISGYLPATVPVIGMASCGAHWRPVCAVCSGHIY